MILAVDMGNTHVVVGAIDGEKTYFLERLTTSSHRTDLEYAVSLKNILDFNHIDPFDLEGAILSSVVPQANSAMLGAIKKVTDYGAIVVNAQMETSLTIDLDNPNELGSDILVTAVASVDQYKLPLAIIDMGTATTIFVVDENRTFRGGIIHPGIKSSLEALSTKTSLLPHIELSEKPPVIGRNTVDCMRSGVLYGHAGMIDGILNRMESELGKDLSVVSTGGLASYVVPLCSHKITIDDELLIKGLHKIYMLNYKKYISNVLLD